MSSRVLSAITVFFCLVALSFGGVAVAKQGDKKDKKNKTASTLAMEVESLESEVTQLSGAEKMDAAVEKIADMRTVNDDTKTLLEKVRKEEKDILKLNCVNEKMAAIKGFLKVSEQSYGHLKEAVDTNDKEAENHHYTLIAIAGQKVSVLGEEARVCAGEVLRFAGDTEVDRSIDPDIAEFDPIEVDDDAFDYDIATERLPELTVFQ